ncbi:Uncharacterized membrane protein [Pseudobutyrivibrio sp. YE44]|uniref:ECF transporter S component n=1 Tax=Pseudobutyrivibrio sp. YE44 TaxID=1520802 RepID=UPI00088C4CD4|nr:ECF transporter S component [Pseudobutyrivibrio sp. YE44]SDB13525.1 Uncharacterized membrane protein [Pseudobutyrivibrio sp. YE44]
MNTKNMISTKDIAMEGMMIALVFLGTFYFKIPTLFGYTHLGDCMIILTVSLLGSKKGALAGALGAGLSDLLGGYTAWVLPTMAIKASWALVMGFVAFKLIKNSKFNLVIGAIVGGFIHVMLYTIVKIPLFGLTYALSTLFTLTLQTFSGVILGCLLYNLIKGKLSVS